MTCGKLNLYRAACLALIAAITALIGCGGGGGGSSDNTTPADTTGPTITNVSVVETSASGAMTASFTIGARVTDTSGVKSVSAVITKPDNSTQTVALSGTTDFSGAWSVGRSTTADQVYSVRITATDNHGNSASATPVNVTVASLDPPPPPPFEAD